MEEGNSFFSLDCSIHASYLTRTCFFIRFICCCVFGPNLFCDWRNFARRQPLGLFLLLSLLVMNEIKVSSVSSNFLSNLNISRIGIVIFF